MGKQAGLGWSIAAAATVTAVFTLSNAATPLYVRWQSEWGFSSGMLTVIFAAYIAGLILTLLFAGRIADRHGRRVILIPGLVLAVGSSLLFLFAQNVAWLLVARLGAGIAVGAAVTAGMAAVVDLAPSGRKHVGSLLASAAMVLGAGLGPLLSGLLTRATDSPQAVVFTVMTVVTLIGTVLGFLLPLSRPATRDVSKWRLPSPPSQHRREVAWGIATFAPGITATSFVLSLGPSVLAELAHTPDALVAGITACVMFLIATGVQFALTRLGTRAHLLLSSIAALLSMLLLTVTALWDGGVPTFTAAAVLAGAAQGLGQLAGITLIGTRIPAARRAESNAALNIAGYLPAAALPVATGFLADRTGLATAVTTFAVIVFIAAAIALPAVRASTSRHPEALQEHHA